MNVLELKRSLKEDRPSSWESIPDMELYMDQILNLMKQQQLGLDEDGKLTASMVNNYIKKGIMPRAKGKKYKRSHVAYLTAICLFKQILSVTETDGLIKDQLEDQEIEDFYKKLIRTIDNEFTRVSDSLHGDMDREELSDTILKLAISSYAQKLACQQLLKFAGELEEGNPL